MWLGIVGAINATFSVVFRANRDVPSPLIGVLSGRRISIIGVLSDMRRGNDGAYIRIE
jgi:hypothetical protein